MTLHTFPDVEQGHAERFRKFVPDAGPECAWCPDPAEEQILMGRRPIDSKTKKLTNVYAWLCGRCARDAKNEKEWSRGG